MDNLRINQDDLELINCVYLNASISVEEIANKLKKKPHVINYTLHKLIEEKIISKVAFIDTYAVGFYQAEVYFSLKTGDEKKISRLINKIIQNDKVPWVGQYLGEFQYAFTFCIKSIDEIFKSTHELFSGFEDCIQNYKFAIRKFYTEYSLKNVTKSKKIESLEFGNREIINKFDKHDHEILKFISNHPNLSYNKVAEKLGVPNSSLHLRIKSLTERNILVGYSYVVDFDKIGLLTFLFMLKLRFISNEDLIKIKKYCQNHPNIIYLVKSFGDWDLKIAINVASASECNKFQQELSQIFGNLIIELKVLSSLNYLKVKRYPFEDYPL